MSLPALIKALRRHDPDCTATDIADILWLAFCAGHPADAPATAKPPSQPLRTKEPSTPREPASTTPGDTSPADTNSTRLGPESDTDIQNRDSQTSHGSGDGSASLHATPGADGPLKTGPGGPDLPPTQPPRARSLLVPGGQALPQRLALTRALRPFTRRVASRSRFEIDEEATVRRIADSGLWQPVLAPGRARWLELAIVLDSHVSMAVWQPALRELRQLLQTLGAFRDVRIWTLDTSADSASGGPVLSSALTDTARSAKELVAPDGRRLVMMVSDCLGPAWRDGSVARWLQPLAHRQPIALWQLLPERLWRQTHLRGARFVHASASVAACPNARLDPIPWRAPLPDWPGVLLPLINAEPPRLAAWARFVAGAPRLRLPAVLLPLSPPPQFAEPLPSTEAASPSPKAEERVLAFRRFASPDALRLAGLLSASVLRFPIMRLVQSVMLPGSSQTALAEIYLGGLLIRVGPQPASGHPDDMDYEFHDGVRELLLKSLWAPDAIETHAHVSRYLQDHLGHRLDFRAFIADPASPLPRFPGEHDRRFASVTAAVLRRLGGDYAKLADRLVGRSRSANPKPSPQKATRFAGVRILWVDDKPANNYQFHKDLPGAEIVEMATTLEALLLLKDESLRFDAILSDLRRPEDKRAGIDLLRELRARGNLIPFGIFSRGIRSPVIEDSFRLGAFACTASFQRLALRLARQIGKVDRYALPEHIHQAVLEILAHLDLPRHVSHVLARDPGSEAWLVFWEAIAKNPIFARVSTLLVAIADCETLKVWSHRVGDADFVGANPSHADSVSAATPGNLVIQTAQRMRTRILKSGEGIAQECAFVPAINRSASTPAADGVLEFHFKSHQSFGSVQRSWLQAFLERLPPLGRGLLFTLPDKKPLAWVLVAGAEKWPEGPDLAVWAGEVGAALADARFGLVCGGWPGVDEAVTAAYLKALARRDANPARFVRQIIEPGREPRIKDLETIHTSSIAESITRSIEAADAVIMIGGAGGTARIGREALEDGVPVLPLPQTGGDALNLYLQLDTELRRREDRSALKALDTSVDKLRQPLVDTIRVGQRSPKSKERIWRIKEALLEALHSHDHDHLVNALNDTDPGHYGVENVNLSIDQEDIDLDRVLRRFTFRNARFTFNARIGSSREEDGIDLPVAKEVSGSGDYELRAQGRVSITAFSINESIDLYDRDEPTNESEGKTV